jgi:tetratricopeptide (TPR) repeat protein
MKFLPAHAACRRILIGATLAAVIISGAPIVSAQNTPHLAESTLSRQLREALSLAKQGDRQGAMTLALQLLQRNPTFVPAIKLKGMLLEEAGQSSAAGATYEEALKLAPNDPDLLLKTGIYKLAEGDWKHAIPLLQHCVKILPADGDAQYYLAQAYHLNGQDDLALIAIRRSLKAEPDNPSVWQKYGELLCGTGDCAGGLRWLLKAQHSDASLPRIDYDIAAADFKLMDLSAAAQYAERAVQANPKDGTALQLLATIDVKVARWQEAKSAYQQLLIIKPNDPEILLGLGQCDVELKNYDTAVETLESLLRLDPTHLLAHFYLSRAFAGMGRTEAAQHEAALHHLMMQKATFVPAVETESRESPIKSQAQQLLSTHREAEALHLYQQHFQGTSATLADAYVFVGKLYLFMGKTEDGLRCLQHALKIQPTVRGAHNYEGILALKLGDLTRAENEFNAELAIDPSSQVAIAEIGEVRYRQERWSEAVEQLEKSKTRTPELLYMLCDSYFHLGKNSDADLNAEVLAAYAKNRPEIMQGLIDLLMRNGQSDLAKRLSGTAAP